MVSRSWWPMVLVVAPVFAQQQQQQQQEEAAPLVIRYLGRHERLDPKLRSLHLDVAAPAELARLGEAPALQRLRIVAHHSGSGHVDPDDAWAEAGADLFAPLGKLSELRWLEIGFFHGCDPQALGVVGRLLQLEELHVIGSCHRIDAAMVAQWTKLPLRRVEFTGAGFERDAFAALCRLPVLERLQLDLAFGLRVADAKHLAQLRQVRELSLCYWGHQLQVSTEARHRSDEGAEAPADDLPEPLLGSDGESWQRRLGGVAGQAVGQLRQLRELRCSGSGLGEGFLGALPTGLTKLDLSGCVGLTALELGKLRRLTALRHLIVNGQPTVVLEGLDGADAVAIDAALANLLPTLAIEELTLHAPVGPLLLPALARCKTLRTIQVLDPDLLEIVRAAVGDGVTVKM